MESNDALTGRTLAHYAVHEVIGAGGMGVVYRARDLQLERPVALKVVGQKDQLDQQAQSRLMREARTASVLNHPNICTIYGAGTEEGVTYIAMELVEGRSLDAIVSAAALPQETVCRYAVQIADALAHAHESGVIHRDLKCANVIITPKGQAKVLDFGLARREAIHAAELVETATQTGVLMGTFAYMAPEILQGNIADARSDLWALGVILYRALSGKLPFHALQRDSPAVLPPSVPPALSAIVHRLLANEPVARYQSAAEVRDALHAIQSATPQGPRRRWLWPAVAAAVVALIVPTAIELARKTPAGGDRLSDGYRPSSNKQANEYYERGITLYGPASTRADPDQMKRMAELAVQADPKFGAARALYAWTLMMQVWSSVSNDSGLLYSAESEARRALSDDPTSGAHRVLAVVHLLQGRKELFPAEADRAAQVNPRDAFVSIFRILYDQLNGDYDRALPRTRQVILRNPLFWPPHWYLGDLLREQGDISGAVQEQSRVLEQDPENGAALASLARAHLDGGDLVQAHQALDRDHSIRGLYRRRAARALLFACEHKRDEAMKEMDAGLETYFSAHAFAPLQAAEFYAVMGDTTKALDWVDRALHMGDDREDWLRRNPHLASIRDNPRFQQMLASVAYRRSQRLRTP